MTFTPRTRIKICGIKSVEDAVFAATAGADAIGLVFYPPSPRYIDTETAQAIASSLPPFVARVGLFVDASTAHVSQVAEQVGLDLIQFHGSESPEECAAVKLPFIKAVQVKEAGDISVAVERYPDARGLLLDAWHPTLHGGTGEQFDWSLLPQDLPLPLILAGGLTPDNVTDAVRKIRPYAVDVSGGVETEKGVKSQPKIAEFIAAVNDA